MSFNKDVEGLKYTKAPKEILAKLHKKYGSWVQVNRRRYDLVFCSVLGVLNMAGDVVMSPQGLCDVESKALFILFTEHTELMESTLIHEIGHAEIHESGFKQRDDWCGNNEEHLVETIGESLSYNYEIKRRLK